MKYVREFVMPQPVPEREPLPFGKPHVSFEDGGQAAIVEDIEAEETGGDGCLFVRLQSWVEGGKRDQHKLFGEMYGKRVRITVETLD